MLVIAFCYVHNNAITLFFLWTFFVATAELSGMPPAILEKICQPNDLQV